MKTKKVMRESKAKARLRQRLTDLAQGAVGSCSVPDGDEYTEGMAAEMGIEAFALWVGAIQRTFGADDNTFDKLWMLENYDTLDRATEYLWDRGVRQ